MCDPTLVMAVNVASKVMAFDAEKKAYNAQVAANERNRKAAHIGYINDTKRLEELAQQKAKKKSLADYKAKKQRRAAVAEAMNVTGLNATAVLKDINADSNMAINENKQAYLADVASLNRKALEAHGAFESVWNSMPMPQKPSLLGTALGIGGDIATARMQQKVWDYKYADKK